MSMLPAAGNAGQAAQGTSARRPPASGRRRRPAGLPLTPPGLAGCRQRLAQRAARRHGPGAPSAGFVRRGAHRPATSSCRAASHRQYLRDACARRADRPTRRRRPHRPSARLDPRRRGSSFDDPRRIEGRGLRGEVLEPVKPDLLGGCCGRTGVRSRRGAVLVPRHASPRAPSSRRSVPRGASVRSAACMPPSRELRRRVQDGELYQVDRGQRVVRGADQPERSVKPICGWLEGDAKVRQALRRQRDHGRVRLRPHAPSIVLHGALFVESQVWSRGARAVWLQPYYAPSRAANAGAAGEGGRLK